MQLQVPVIDKQRCMQLMSHLKKPVNIRDEDHVICAGITEGKRVIKHVSLCN